MIKEVKVHVFDGRDCSGVAWEENFSTETTLANLIQRSADIIGKDNDESIQIRLIITPTKVQAIGG